MASGAKRKGDRAELEVQALLRDHLGVPARRMLGAGRRDDIGDITGVPDTTIQVAAWAHDFAHGVRVKPLECEEERKRAGTTHAATFMRLRGGDYRVVLTVEQWCALWREAVSDGGGSS